MLSILPTNANDVPCVPIEVFQEGIRDAIEKKTGEKLSLEVFDTLDMSVFGRLIGIDKVKVTIIPGLLNEIVCLRVAAYNRAVVNGLLMKED